jgi:hypothetical protein
MEEPNASISCLEDEGNTFFLNSVTINKTTLNHNPEKDRNPNFHHHKSLISLMILFVAINVWLL